MEADPTVSRTLCHGTGQGCTIVFTTLYSQGGVLMADPSPEVRPELDRRSFLKGSSVAALG
ncbi:MAG TPA: twin-arginine translocation signal domain-containing protein, partial [Thermoanaerobaculia bacterium]